MDRTDTVSVECGCGTRLRAPASKAGKRARCPKCGATNHVPAPSPAPPPAPVAAPASPRVRITDVGVVPAARSPAVLPAPPITAPPAPMIYHTFGRPVAVEVERGPGRVGLGALLGVAFAGAWGVAWVIVGSLLNIPAGAFGALTGVLAACGMLLGTRGRRSFRAGTIAAAVALGVILVAKVAIYASLLAQFDALQDDPGALEFKLLQEHMAEQNLIARQIDPETAASDQWKTAQMDALIKLGRMDLPEMEAVGDRMNRDRLLAQLAPGGFFGEMIGGYDVLWVALALSGAYTLCTLGDDRR